MTPASNPFAPPVEAEPPTSLSKSRDPALGPWRTGDLVATGDGARWPEACVRCGTTTDLTTGWRRLRWWPPGIVLLLPLGILPYVLARVAFQRVYRVRVSICPVHRMQHVAAAIGVPLVSFGAAVAAGQLAEVLREPLVFLLALPAVAVPLLFPRGSVWGASFDDDEQVMSVSGTHPAFRALLAEAPPKGPREVAGG